MERTRRYMGVESMPLAQGKSTGMSPIYRLLGLYLIFTLPAVPVGKLFIISV